MGGFTPHGELLGELGEARRKLAARDRTIDRLRAVNADLLAACKAVAEVWRVSDGFDAGDCRLCGAYVYPESGHFTDCPIPAIDAAIAKAEEVT